MKLDKDVDLKSLSNLMEEFSGAEIKAVCTETGYFAIRENRTKVTKKDFLNAINKVRREGSTEGQDYLNMFG